MSTSAQMRAHNQRVIAEFRARDGVVTESEFPILLRTRVGARPGRPTTTPVAYRIDGESVFVVASKAGAPGNPASFTNVQANPSVPSSSAPLHIPRRRS
jgi:hypothetical protein